MKRRDALATLGLGTLGLMTLGRGAVADPRGRIDVDDLDDLSRRFREASARGSFDVAAEAIQAGAGPQALLGAVFLAGIHDVEPRPVGGRLHCVMMTESAFALASDAHPERVWLAALWNLDYFKQMQREDAERGRDWVLPPRPEVSFASEALARKELVAAMEAWDPERADRAIVGLIPYHDRQSLFEILWPYTARCIEYLGHKIVYGAQVEKVLRRIDWQYAEPTLRAMVYGLVGFHGEPKTASWKTAVELAPSLRDGWQDGKADSDESLRLLHAFRTSTPVEAQRRVVAALNDGIATDSVWDGIRLAAAELFLQRGSENPLSGEAIRAVHPVTELHAFGHAWRTATIDANRRALLLQAAAWVPQMRDALVERKALAKARPGLDTLGQGQSAKPAELREVLDAPTPVRVRAALEQRPDKARLYLERLRFSVVREATESHQFKYVVALEEEARLADPRWRTRLLSAGVPYMPTGDGSASELYQRSKRTLGKAGVA